jgi:hypothetical protein
MKIKRLLFIIFIDVAKEIFIPEKCIAEILISIVFSRVMPTLKAVFTVAKVTKQLEGRKVVLVNYRGKYAKGVGVPRKRYACRQFIVRVFDTEIIILALV